jgi:hypothetical protein
MRIGGRQGLFCAALTLVPCLLGPSAAVAEDANSVPPRVFLWAGGEQEGLLGPRGKGRGYNESVAYFVTEAPDPSWEYKKESMVSFSCSLDGQPVSCEAEQVVCCGEVVPLPRRLQAREEPRPRDGYGAFHGEVAAPANLASGWHTVSVSATDEDGTDPSPPTARFFLDREPPSAPRLIKAPARVSHNHKPRFRYFSTDNKGFPTRTYTSTELFKARLRRLRPAGPLLGKGDPFGNYLEWRGPFCPTPRRCTETDFAAYSASAGNGAFFGVPERLNPGLYEFTVKAFDAVGNRSPLTRYRFRVLP